MPKKSWSSEEDCKLINYVNEYTLASTKIKWKIIGQKLSKSPSSCFSRYNRCLSPDVRLRNRKWSKEEDTLIEILAEKNMSWTKIKYYLSGRSDLSIYNRWQYLLNKKNKNIKSKNIDIKPHQPSINQQLDAALEKSSRKTDSTGILIRSPFSSSSSTSSCSSDFMSDDCPTNCLSAYPTIISSAVDVSNNCYKPSNYLSYDTLNYRMDLVFLTNPN